jgi:2-polyprenyl-3-methyl-5-hydroxy-6-metoxy-1,4-benzoquinol methylase
MDDEKYRVIEDPLYGYKRLDPIPSEIEVANFYESQYSHLIRQEERAPHLRRLLSAGKEARDEHAWFCSGLYADVLAILEQQRGSLPKRLVDLGCGTGGFMAFMKQNGWQVVGLELAQEFAALAKSQDLEVYSLNINDFIAKYPQYLSTFSVVVLLNVLEHVPNPMNILDIAKKLLVDQGMLVITVPNDFSELQLSAQKQLGKEPWWITIPDHINYFDYQSSSSLLERQGFEVIYSQSDYPMELFLLSGDDYTGNPEVGNQCHQKRVQLEKVLPGELRRKLYRAFAQAGIGRNCLIFGRLTGR